jgi:hypothetical protein
MAARNRRRLTWTDVALAATAVTLNVGAVALLSLTDVGLRNRPMRSEPMIIYLDDAWPRLARAPQATAGAERAPFALTHPDRTTTATNESIRPLTPDRSPLSPQPGHRQDEAIDPQWRVGRVGPASNGLVMSCDAPHLLSMEARRRCDDRWTGHENARAIVGTGNAQRDSTFARHGARRLAAWEAQRAAPTDADEPCLQLGPIVECSGANIQVELFSSRDGFLPNLRKRRE